MENSDIVTEYKQRSTKRANCNKTIDEVHCVLVSGDNDFMTKDKIEKECGCKNSDTCKAICGLLKSGKIEEAKTYL